MIDYNKDEIKEQLTINEYAELLTEWGGEPEYTSFGLISSTICHNRPDEGGSRKLYWYSNSSLFHCYTGCEDPSYDIFQLVIKIAKLQWNQNYDLNDAVRWIARRFGLSGTVVSGSEEEQLEDWKLIAGYDRIKSIELKENQIFKLKEYDNSILKNFNYTAKISPWLNEGISQESIEKAHIGFYPGKDQITIPHYDEEGNFIGLRGRALSKEEAELYGKYRPLKINKVLYNHPLGFNLYGLSWNKKNIETMEKVIVFESEKAVLQYGSYFGWDNNIAVSCCGSNLSNYQVNLLRSLGVKEIIIAFDRQFQEIGDKEFKHLVKNLQKLRDKYKNFVNISLIFDKNKITNYKASPIDEGAEKFLKLFKERIFL